MTLRYGILSTSSIAPRFIAGVRQAEAGEILALSSRTLQKAEEKALLWDIPRAYGSHEELLQDPDIDIVYISTVNALHYKWARAALEHGKHVVCEKPCTTSEEDTRALFRLAREKGLFLMEAQKMLFLPAVQQLRQKLSEGILGDISMVRLSHSFPASYNGWMFDKAAGGGTLLSSGIYAVQLILHLFGEIRELRGSFDRDENGVERQYVLSGQTAGGVLFSIHNSSQVPLDNTACFYGEKGWAELPEYWKARKVIFHTEGEAKAEEFPCEHELMYEAAHIKACLDKGLTVSPVVTEKLSCDGIAALQAVSADS